MNDKTKGSLLIFTAAMLWSTGGILMKLVPWNSLMINGARSLIAFFFICLLNRTVKIKFNRYIVLSALCISFTTTLFAMANKLTTAANAIVLQYTAPAFVLVISCIAAGKLPGLKQILVVLAAFGGTVLFFMDELDAGHVAGNVLAIASGLTYAGLFFFNSRPESSNDDSLRLACLISFGIFLVTVPFKDYGPVAVTPGIVAAVIALGVVQIGLAYYTFGRGLKLINPVAASLISLFEAIFNPVWVALFTGELPGPFALLGAGVIILAVVYIIVFVQPVENERS